MRHQTTSPSLSRRQFLTILSSIAVLSGSMASLEKRKSYALIPESPQRDFKSINKPNLVVYLADSLRADHLNCYDYPVPTSPSINLFAQESYLFEKCYSQSCWTKPSIASLFTGVLPRIHQACVSHWNYQLWDKIPLQVLRESFVTLAESLSASGYHTALFLANPMVKEFTGIPRGFQDYKFECFQDAESQMDKALDWLKGRAKEPYLLFIQTSSAIL